MNRASGFCPAPFLLNHDFNNKERQKSAVKGERGMDTLVFAIAE